ncbi:MAG TPA: hypothetical protein VHF22_11740, partial [Planctomycetota bacterium]|nr:hypothetical protein [Planctomycetota bacterium]
RHQEKQGDFQNNGYGAIGPSLALGILDVPETSPFHSFDFDPDVSPGLDLRAGLELDFSGPFKVFVEYRFFYTGFKFEDSATVFGGAVRERFELDAMVNAINFGIRF